MTGVRVLVGTQKGAFVLSADGRRAKWEVTGPLFGGWEVYHVVASPAEPARLFASQSLGWFGQVIQLSDDGGRSWRPAGNDFRYADGVAPTRTSMGRCNPGSSGVSGSSGPRTPIQTLSSRVSKTLHFSSRPTLARPGRSSPVCGATPRAPGGSPERAECASIRS